MGSSMMTATSLFGLTGLAGVLSDGAIRATLLLLIVFAVVGLLRQSSAAARHLAWSAGLISVLALPLLAVSLPWRLEVLPTMNAGSPTAAAPAVGPSDVVEVSIEPAGDVAHSTPAPAPGGDQHESQVSTHAAPIAMADGAPAIDAPAPATWSLAASTPTGATSELGLLDIFLAAWAVVAVLLTLRLVAGVLAVWFLVRRSQPLTGHDWRGVLRRATRRLGVASPVRLLMSDRVTVPITAGLVRPVIVLPRAAGSWTEDRRGAVLLHELAHIKRWDWGTHLVARAVCALHWFNPLFWVAAKRLRMESERACDDMVLEAGTQPSCYADHLLQIVKTVGRTHAPAGALPLAQRSEFEGRLLAILETGIPRHRPKPLRAVLLSALVIGIAVPLAAMAPMGEDTGEVTSDPGTFPVETETEPDLTREIEVGTTLRALRGDGHPETPVAPKTESVDPSFDAPHVDTAIAVPLDIDIPVAAAKGQGRASIRRTALVTALRDSDARVRVAAMNSLGELITEGADSTEIAALSRALRTDPEPQVRRMAAWALGEIEDARGIPALSDALRTDQDTGVRKMAAWALGEIEDAQAVPALGAALEDEDPEVRRAAIHALGEIESPTAVEFLIPALSSDDVQIRKHAAWALGEIDDARAVDPLAAALKDANAEVRRAAAHGLGEIESPRAVDALVAALKDADPQVRRHAAWALGEIEDARAVGPLGAALKDSDAEVRRAAIYALGEIESPIAVDMLIPALKDADQKVRRYAAWALGEVEDPRAKDPLIAAVGDRDAEVRRAAINALSELELRPAPPAVVKALTDTDPEVRRAAAHALGHWEDPATIPALKAAMKDADPKVRRVALMALAEMPNQQALDALVEALKDDDPVMRRAAARALGKNE